MSSITIKSKEKTNQGFRFRVEVADGGDKQDFTVDVREVYWRKLTNEAVTPDELVKRSFEFLLAREPKESILREFNLKQITTYFPEYEEEMKRD